MRTVFSATDGGATTLFSSTSKANLPPNENLRGDTLYPSEIGVPEAPLITDIPDLDCLFGTGDGLSDLRPSQWLPATQHKLPLREITNKSIKSLPDADISHNVAEMETMVSERGDSQEILLGSQFPLVKKVKNQRTAQLFSAVPSMGNQKKVTHSSLKNAGVKPTKSYSGTPRPRENGDGNTFFQTPAALVLPATKMRQGMCLRSVLEIQQYRAVFRFQYFNIVQSKVFDDILYTDRSLVICSPTGSGKTAIFEMAIIRLLTNVGPALTKDFKVVYMAPIKALCSERYQDWKEKFEPLGLKVMELTGDTDLEDFYLLQEVNIVLTTPEKWDSMTRKWRDNKSVVQAIYLFLVDEIHILNDETRGATVEAVLSRMKTIQAARSRSGPKSTRKSDLHDLRFVAASATLTNIDDLAAWLGTGKNLALYHKFDDNVRPVRLRKVVLGYNCSDKQSPFQFDITLNYKLAGIINTYSEGKPSLVFCSTRKSVTQGADVLAKDMKSSFVRSGQHRQQLQNSSFHLKDSKLRELVMKGIGYHHAGMDFQDRKSIEEMFANGELPVLVATSTLAMGVNLPAHLVIIKSTMYYNMGCHEEYSDTQVLQMIGRAGRPQFDISATAVIMTKTQTKNKYDNLLNGTQLIESNLHKNLIEHLNAEIVLGTITDISVAVEWLKFTFLYIRVMKNPGHYGMPTGLTKNSMEKRLQDLCMKNLNQLHGLNLLQLNEDTLDVKPTENGRLMARYCISYKTAELFNTITEEETIENLLEKISKCEEFEDIKLRTNEKKTLNTLNRDKNRVTIRYPIPGKIKTKDMKVNCLVQAQLGCLLVQDFALQQDTSRIFRVGNRVTRCLVEFLSQRENTNSYRSVLSALQLCKAFKSRLWENSKFVSKQLDGIGPMLSNALVNAGLTTFEKIEQTNPREIELILNRHPPFGNQVRDSVLKLPKYELVIEQIARYSETSAEIVISLQITNRDQLNERPFTGHTCTLLIGDKDNRVVYKQRIMDNLILKETVWTKKITVYLATKGPELDIHYISQDWVGLDIECTYIPNYIGGVRISNATAILKNETPSLTDENSIPLKPRRKQTKSQAKLTESKPKPVLPTKAVASHRNDLKSKSSFFPATPSLMKRPKLQFADEGNYKTPIDLTEYTYKPRTKCGSSPSKSSPQNQSCGFNGDESEIFYAMPYHDEYEIHDGGQYTSRGKMQLEVQKSACKKNDWSELDLYQRHRETCRLEEAQEEYNETDSLPDLDFNWAKPTSNVSEETKSITQLFPVTDGMMQETDYGCVYVGGNDQSQIIDWDDKVTEDMSKDMNTVKHLAMTRKENSDNPEIEFRPEIESCESEDDKDENHPSKWTGYFSSQSSTASDYLKHKYPARYDNHKVIMEDNRAVRIDRGSCIVGRMAVNGCDNTLQCGNDHSFYSGVEPSVEKSHKFGQVLAWVSDSQNQDLSTNKSTDSEFESWSDEDYNDENLIQFVGNGEVEKRKSVENCNESVTNTTQEKELVESNHRSKMKSSVFFPASSTSNTDNDFTSIFDGLF